MSNSDRIDNIWGMTVFSAVWEKGSFSEAARALGLKGTIMRRYAP